MKCKKSKCRKTKYKKVIVSVAILILSLFAFTGCIPNGYTRAEKNAFLRKAEKAASDYLESAYDGAVIKEIEAEITVEDMEYVLTEFARGRFRWQGQHYFFVVNAETGEIYTSVHLNEIKEGLEEVLIRELEIDSHEEIAFNYISYYLQGGGAERSTFFNVFPEGETAEELLQEILTDAEAYSFSMDIQYKGGEIPQEIMEEDAPFPTLSYISLYHIAEEHELGGEEYRGSNLAVLSEEILKCSYTEDSAEYTRNQVMERDGLRVVYGTYERKKVQDSVTERVMDEKDIRLTVTEEYIALDCTKERFDMYLTTADRDIAEEYIYAFDDTISEKKPLKGMWYPCGDIYIYSEGRFIEMPHNFNNYRKETNMIFSRKNYDRF